MGKKLFGHRGEEQEAGLHTTNDAGELTPQQTSEQQQQGNYNLDNQKEGAQVFEQDGNVRHQQRQPQGLQVPKSATAEDMKGTVADPVSFSNPAFDPSIDAAKVGLRGKDAEKESSDLLHVFKPGHFYKKGDKVRYHGIFFEALQDGHGDIPPSMWAPTGEEDPSSAQ